MTNSELITSKFADETINATVRNILWSVDNLTPIEFRMWAEHCKVYDNFHPSHFKGLEEAFISTGKWEQVD